MVEETSPALPELDLDHTLTGPAAEALRTLHMMFGESVGGDIDDTALAAFRIAGLVMAATNGGQGTYFVTVPPAEREQETTGDDPAPFR